MTPSNWKKLYKARDRADRCNCLSCLRSDGFTPPHSQRHRAVNTAVSMYGRVAADLVVAEVWPNVKLVEIVPEVPENVDSN